MSFCSRRAVQASSSYGPRVPSTPSLQSDAACQQLAGAARCGIKDIACPVPVPCAEKCWSTPTPLSLHAEKVCSSSLSYEETCAAKCGHACLVIKRNLPEAKMRNGPQVRLQFNFQFPTSPRQHPASSLLSMPPSAESFWQFNQVLPSAQFSQAISHLISCKLKLLS